jgi:hypothetical protein
MKTYKVTYKGKEYTLDANLRSRFLWESATERVFNPKTTYDLFLNIWCTFKGNNIDIDANELLAYADENPSFMNDFYESLSDPADPHSGCASPSTAENPAGRTKATKRVRPSRSCTAT